MNSTYRDRTLALAGLFLATSLVAQTARRGMADSDALACSLGSLFIEEPTDTLDVYGGQLNRLRPGLLALREQLGTPRRSPEQIEPTRYAIGLLHLERKLMRNPAMLSGLDEGIQRARQQVDHFGLLHANVMAGLADTYSRIISPLGPRILVNGEQLHLGNPDTANRIRALLLAGIRSAVLWYQVGGRRWQIILGRRRLLQQTEALLAEPPPEEDGP